MATATPPGMTVRESEPRNLESPFSALDGLTTPADLFYVRNHFQIPSLNSDSYRLTVEGAVRQRPSFSMSDLIRLPAVTETVTLECAGNARIFLSPAVSGAQWELGAVSTARWTGVKLIDLLSHAGVLPEAVDVIFEGSDTGKAKEQPAPPGEIRYARSVPIDQCGEIILAYAMNEEPLTPAHGFPLRAIVPGWFGMASVKWLKRIIISDQPFAGYFQTTDYAYWQEKNGLPIRVPITRMQLKAQIARPAPWEVVPARSKYRIFGAAWSGGSPVAKVEVSTDGGKSFTACSLLGEALPHAWRLWEFDWQAPTPGEATLIARATDSDGQVQPAERDSHWGTYVICHTLSIPVVVR